MEDNNTKTSIDQQSFKPKHERRLIEWEDVQQEEAKEVREDSFIEIKQKKKRKKEKKAEEGQITVVPKLDLEMNQA